MTKKRTIDVARALKDEEYRNSLTEEERASLPKNPAGSIDLNDAELDGVSGGRPYISNRTCTIRDSICCSSGDLCA